MTNNFSQQTSNTLIQEYQFRVEALSKRIEQLQAQIEVSQIYKQNG
jgi:hypothetical protein